MRTWLLGSLLVLSLSLAAQAQDEAPSPILGPTIGHVDTSSALLWVRVPRAVEAARVSIDGGRARQVRLRVLGRGFARIPVSGLRAGATHRVKVALGGTTTELQVKAAPLPRAWGKVRFGVGSCARYSNQPVWDTVAKLNLDLFLWLGDNVYYRYRKGGGADWDKLPWMLERQLEGRDRPNLLRAMQRMACYATWDDHDYGPNNADGRFPLRAEARLVHRYMWANPGCGEQDEGVYFRFRRGPVEFFLLDDRSFKEVRRKTPRAQRVLYGARQMAWLRRGIAASDAPLKVIAGGVQQLLGYPGAEGWDQAPAERKAFLTWLEREGSRALFLSGDIHLSELYQVKLGSRSIWELTSSGLGNKTKLASVFKALGRSERKWIETEANVCTIDVEIPAPPRRIEEGTVRFRCLGVDGALRHETKTTLATFSKGGAPKASGKPGGRRRSF